MRVGPGIRIPDPPENRESTATHDHSGCPSTLERPTWCTGKDKNTIARERMMMIKPDRKVLALGWNVPLARANSLFCRERGEKLGLRPGDVI